VILSSFVWIGYQRVTDRKTDRWMDGQTDGITVAKGPFTPSATTSVDV